MDCRALLIGASSVPAAAALDANAGTGTPDFPWTVRVEEDWGSNRLNDCLVLAPCDGFVCDNTYQLMSGEIVAMDVHPNGIRINRKDREPEFVALDETPDLIRGMVVHTASASARWRRKVWTGG